MAGNGRRFYTPARTRRDKNGNVTVEGGYIDNKSGLLKAAYQEGKKATKRSKPQKNSRAQNAARGAVNGAVAPGVSLSRTVEQARRIRQKKVKNRDR